MPVFSLKTSDKCCEWRGRVAHVVADNCSQNHYRNSDQGKYEQACVFMHPVMRRIIRAHIADNHHAPKDIKSKGRLKKSFFDSVYKISLFGSL